MSEQEFYEFLNRMDEDELHSFSEMIDQYMEKYGSEGMDDQEVLASVKKSKRHFDAWLLSTNLIRHLHRSIGLSYADINEQAISYEKDIHVCQSESDS